MLRLLVLGIIAITLKPLKASDEELFQIWVRIPQRQPFSFDIAPSANVRKLYEKLPPQFQNCSLRFGQITLNDKDIPLADVGIGSEATLELDFAFKTISVNIKIKYVTALQQFDDDFECMIELEKSLIPQIKDCVMNKYMNNDDLDYGLANWDIDLMTSRIKFGYDFYSDQDVRIGGQPEKIQIAIVDLDKLILVQRKNSLPNDVMNHGVIVENLNIVNDLPDIDYSAIYQSQDGITNTKDALLIIDHETIAKYPLRIIGGCSRHLSFSDPQTLHHQIMDDQFIMDGGCESDGC